MPKNVELTYIQLQNMKKTRRGDAFETLNFFSKKSRTVPKKSRGGTLKARPVL